MEFDVESTDFEIRILLENDESEDDESEDDESEDDESEDDESEDDESEDDEYESYDSFLRDFWDPNEEDSEARAEKYLRDIEKARDKY